MFKISGRTNTSYTHLSIIVLRFFETEDFDIGFTVSNTFSAPITGKYYLNAVTNSTWE